MIFKCVLLLRGGAQCRVKKLSLLDGKWCFLEGNGQDAVFRTFCLLNQHEADCIKIGFKYLEIHPHQFGTTVFFLKIIFKKRSKESAFPECCFKERVWSRHFNETRVQSFGKCPTRFPAWETSGYFASVKKWNTFQGFLCNVISQEIHFFVSI